MGRVLEYEIPVLHPLAVHFPVVLLLVAALAVAVWAISDREGWLRAAAWLAGLGAVSAVVARQTGETMEDQSEGAPLVEALVELHELAANWTMWLAVIMAVALMLLLFGDRWWPERPGTPRAVRLAMVVLGAAVAAAVLWTAHIGGVMVWGIAR